MFQRFPLQHSSKYILQLCYSQNTFVGNPDRVSNHVQPSWVCVKVGWKNRAFIKKKKRYYAPKRKQKILHCNRGRQRN